MTQKDLACSSLESFLTLRCCLLCLLLQALCCLLGLLRSRRSCLQAEQHPVRLPFLRIIAVHHLYTQGLFRHILQSVYITKALCHIPGHFCSRQFAYKQSTSVLIAVHELVCVEDCDEESWRTAMKVSLQHTCLLDL